jgi:hypothetical protein
LLPLRAQKQKVREKVEQKDFQFTS